METEPKDPFLDQAEQDIAEKVVDLGILTDLDQTVEPETTDPADDAPPLPRAFYP